MAAKLSMSGGRDRKLKKKKVFAQKIILYKHGVINSMM